MGAQPNAPAADTAESELAPAPAIAATPPVVDVTDLDWLGVRDRVIASTTRAHLRDVVERMEALLDRDGGPRLLFDEDRTDANDKAICVSHLEPDAPLWVVGDIHGDLLALEAALELVRITSAAGGPASRLVFLGDLFDDGGYGLEVLLRVFELILDAPESVCIIAGNHDEALDYTGAGFTATVTPSDFSDFLNANLAHEWITRAGKLAVRLFSAAPRALFLPDGLLITHGGFPLVDLHAELRESGDWNDPRCLDDFTWTRAHPRASRKMPNRTSRGSQFGYEDFAAFCELSAELGRQVTHMVRGHDHVDERYEIYPAYAAHPVLTTVALSRRLPREMFGPYERAPTIARWVPDALPQVHRLCIPAAIVREVYPDDEADADESHATDAAVGEHT
jgi:Calcineurin-like phosphoesterase